jgi:hypothetical protein
MERRSLALMLEEVAGALLVARQAGFAVHARSITLDLPIEVRFRPEVESGTLLADVPVWRWRTIFDQPISRLRVTLAEASSP